MLQRDLQLLKAVFYLIISKPESDLTGNFSDLLSNAGRQFSQDGWHMLNPYDASAGTGVQNGHSGGLCTWSG